MGLFTKRKQISTGAGAVISSKGGSKDDGKWIPAAIEFAPGSPGDDASGTLSGSFPTLGSYVVNDKEVGEMAGNGAKSKRVGSFQRPAASNRPRAGWRMVGRGRNTRRIQPEQGWQQFPPRSTRGRYEKRGGRGPDPRSSDNKLNNNGRISSNPLYKSNDSNLDNKNQGNYGGNSGRRIRFEPGYGSFSSSSGSGSGSARSPDGEMLPGSEQDGHAQNEEPRHHHHPSIDSDPEESSSDEDGSYISGEYDEEFNNSEGFVPRDGGGPNSPTTVVDALVGVSPSDGKTATPRQLEEELYLYKLETLNLTDACRELTEQLEECESRLGSVQAQAAFRINALEVELQDGNLGLKGLVRATSAEMDARLDALRALGRTATFQAAKLRERDSKLIFVEQRLRKVRRDAKSLKRENKKVANERSYLKGRLGELDQAKLELEEHLKQLATENTAAVAMVGEDERERVEKMKKELNDTLDRMGYMKTQLDCRKDEMVGLKAREEEKIGEVLELREELDAKEHSIVRMEQQLEKVHNDVLYAVTSNENAEHTRIGAEARESSLRNELDETLGALDEVSAKMALLESREACLRKELDNARSSDNDGAGAERRRARLEALEREAESLREEKEVALDAANDARALYAEAIKERDAQIDTLKKDVEVHRQQMELAQTMLEDNEMLTSELQNQIKDTIRDEKMRMAHLEENLAARAREVGNVKAKLEERTKDISSLEEKLAKVRKEFMESRAELEVTRAEAAIATAKLKEDEDESNREEDKEAQAVHIAEQMAKLAEKETQIERVERELGTSKRQLDAARVELEKKDEHAERLKAELGHLKAERGVRVKKLEQQLNERNQGVQTLQKDLGDKRRSLDTVVVKLNKVQVDLDVALEAAQTAEEALERILSEKESSKRAAEAARREADKLRSQVDSLQKANKSVMNEAELLKSDADKEKKSCTQAAAALAATNAARQAEMEMKIEKMSKEIKFKKREISTIKSELYERDHATAWLKIELNEAKEDLVNYKEQIESEKEKAEAEALQRIADRDYFDEAEDALSATSSTDGGNKPRGVGRGLLSGLFNQSATDFGEDQNVDWEARAREKDLRISQLEKSLPDNALTISNLKNELVAASSKFKQDESQRRLLIQRLESENQAYSIKLGVLETEFEEIRKRKEAIAITRRNSFLTDDGSVASSINSNASARSGTSATTAQTGSSTGVTAYTGVSSITGAGRMTPLERDNRKLKKQKKVYETRIISLQTQLSEIQQILPELMSKSKSQVQKLEAVMETQRDEAEEREKKLTEEFERLKSQNEQLQATTRSRLQSSDNGQQDEIDQLRMRLEAREATIKKLEMLAGRGEKILRKKKGDQ